MRVSRRSNPFRAGVNRRRGISSVWIVQRRIHPNSFQFGQPDAEAARGKVEAEIQ
jgi:hypothetical protein